MHSNLRESHRFVRSLCCLDNLYINEKKTFLTSVVLRIGVGSRALRGVHTALAASYERKARSERNVDVASISSSTRTHILRFKLTLKLTVSPPCYIDFKGEVELKKSGKYGPWSFEKTFFEQASLYSFIEYLCYPMDMTSCVCLWISIMFATRINKHHHVKLKYIHFWNVQPFKDDIVTKVVLIVNCTSHVYLTNKNAYYDCFGSAIWPPPNWLIW